MGRESLLTFPELIKQSQHFHCTVMSSCRAQVQPRGLKPKAKASTATTSLDCSPDSRADRCPVSPWATNTERSLEQKTKQAKLNLKNLFNFPSGLVLVFVKARHLISCQISHPSYRSLHIRSLWDQRDSCNSIQVHHNFIVVLSLKRYLCLAHFTQSSVLFVESGNVRTVFISLQIIFVLGGAWALR